MTKLEQKLVELGYEKEPYFPTIYCKEFNCALKKNIFLSLSFTKIETSKITPYGAFRKQQDIDNLQQAFDEMQKDLEILKGCEE